MIVRIFQRYAGFFAIFAGLTFSHFVLPKDIPFWIGLAVTVSVAAVVFLLLYKDGVTGNRRKR
jgi:hypothetical protein